MRTAFHEQLDALTRSIGDMCGLTGIAMHRATHALLEGQTPRVYGPRNSPPD
jgi:phosphate transport system protein